MLYIFGIELYLTFNALTDGNENAIMQYVKIFVRTDLWRNAVMH